MTNKTNRVWRMGAAAAFALSGVFLSGNAHAAGTNAGTPVSNTFTLDYQVAGVDQPQINNNATPTTFTVDRVIRHTVTSLGDVSVAPGASPAQGAQLVFSLVNSGNDNQGYQFALEDPAQNDFDPTGLVIRAFREDDGTPGAIDGTNTEITLTANAFGTGATDHVAPDELILIVVEGTIPNTATDGQRDDVVLSARAQNPATSLDAAYTGTPGTPVAADTGGNTQQGEAENVFDDPAGDATANGGPTPFTGADVARDGFHSDTAAFIIAAANLSAQKLVFPISNPDDPDANGPSGALTTTCQTITDDTAHSATAIMAPGSCIEYVIRVTNASTSGTPAGDATGIDISDVLPDEVTFVAASVTGSLTGGTVATTPAACDALTVNCTVSVTGASIVAPTAPATSTVGELRIRAFVE